MAEDNDIQIIDIEQQTKPRGRPSDLVWEHFEKIPPKKGSTRLGGRCNHCKIVIQDGRLEYLYRHIPNCSVATPQIKHQVMQMQAKKAVVVAVPSGRKRKSLNQTTGTGLQQTIVTSYGQSRLPTAVRQTCNVKLLRMVIMSSSAFTLVDDPFFIDFVQTLSPGYILPGALF